MEIIYPPRFDLELESLIERMNPPRVCIDNDSCEDCTVVKVDSANKHGILLEMVQVLTDLDLVISKSYISSDGGWFMDVFHVTDRLGNKLTDESLILYIQQALCATRREGGGLGCSTSSMEDEGVQLQKCSSIASRMSQRHVSLKHTALEMTGKDRPGLISEISAVLVELGCSIISAGAWTHNDRMACIIYVQDVSASGPITDTIRLTHMEEQLQMVVGPAHNAIEGENRKCVRSSIPAAGGNTHTERRLHQLMCADKDYERCRACHGDGGGVHKKGCDGTHVSIERCKDRGYWVVNVRSRDRPKLLFDTVCALTDMHYVVFHAAVSSKGSMADQEYFVRHKGGFTLTLDTEAERQKLTLCLIAATERRVSHGLRIDMCTKDRTGLLSDVTRVFRENGLSISRVEIGTQGGKAVGSFYVTDSSGQDVNPRTVDMVRNQIGGSITAIHKSYPNWVHNSRTGQGAASNNTARSVQDRPTFSVGSLLWSQLERLSSNFGPIKSLTD